MTHGFQIERLIDAAPEEVFDAMTDPRIQREWWVEAGTFVSASGDLRVGGTASIEWQADEGHRCRADQVYVEIDRPHRLVLTETVTEPNAPTLSGFSAPGVQAGRTHVTLAWGS